MNRFLIIQTAFIGDVILATPVVEALHKEYPGAGIDFLLRKGNEGLLQGHPFLSEVIIWDKKKQKYADLYRIIRSIRKKKYDAVINLQRFWATGLTTILSGAVQTVGFDKNPLSCFFSVKVPHLIDNQDVRLHEIDRNLSLLKHLIKSPRRYLPRLYPAEKDFLKTAQTLPYITISPTSVWFTKQYPADRWVQLINLTDSAIRVFLLGGKADREACEQIKSGATRPNIETLAGQLTFLESAALMKNAVMNYVNDSAPLHLASSMDAPVTAVFCSTVPAFGFGPLSSQSYILETEEKLDCRPCGIHGHNKCPLGHFRCSHIDPGRLHNTLDHK
ncbi:MAG: glycosyltransferase family 9 protein [Bacteroidales bacterium]|nr:glycosyltransferase family 9 protein [Bacteroidales bacterium]